MLTSTAGPVKNSEPCTSECAPISKQYSYIVNRLINAIKLLDLFVLKYIYSKMRVICYEWIVLVRICDVVRLRVTALNQYICYIAQLSYYTPDPLPIGNLLNSRAKQCRVKR